MSDHSKLIWLLLEKMFLLRRKYLF